MFHINFSAFYLGLHFEVNIDMFCILLLQNPMDFATIEKKLKEKAYTNRQEVCNGSFSSLLIDLHYDHFITSHQRIKINVTDCVTNLKISS